MNLCLGTSEANAVLGVRLFLLLLGVFRSHCLEAGVLEQIVVPMVTREAKFSLIFLGNRITYEFLWPARLKLQWTRIQKSWNH